MFLCSNQLKNSELLQTMVIMEKVFHYEKQWPPNFNVYA